MKAVLFDLDNTLYPPERDLFSLIDVRINRYMEEIAAIDPREVDGLRRRYWRDYGTTLAGLIRHHAVDPEAYLDYVHAIDVTSRLSRDPDLQQSLKNLQLPSYVFTNGSRGHVERVIAALGLEGLFADVFDIRIADYLPKPHPEPYLRVLKKLGSAGEQCVMVEDQHQNLETAKLLGMQTVLVGPPPPAGEQPDYVDAYVAGPTAAADLVRAWLNGA